MFGTFEKLQQSNRQTMFGNYENGRMGYSAPTAHAPAHPTFGPAMGDSVVEHKIGMRGYDGGVHNSPFQNGRIKEPFTAPGPYNPFMFMRPRRRRLNLLSTFQAVILPFILFGFTMFLMGFSVHNNDPKWCWMWMIFCPILAFVFLVKGFMVYRKYRKDRWNVPWYLLDDDDTWFMVIGVFILFACASGFIIGTYIFENYTHEYYKLSLLHNYENIDPISEGKAYLDAGSVLFKNTSFVDTVKAIGYKDGTIYCVAPIKYMDNATANFDFWAVGKDCCSGFPGNFNCFESRVNGFAHGGLRVVNDDDIAFYRLAVTQAMGEFKPNSELIKDNRVNSINPLFFTWMKDPVGELQKDWHDALWIYGVSLASFFVGLSIVVFYLAKAYWTNRLWG